MVKAVFFDLYNTIAGFQPRREEVQAIAARDLGLDLEPARGSSEATSTPIIS